MVLGFGKQIGKSWIHPYYRVKYSIKMISVIALVYDEENPIWI